MFLYHHAGLSQSNYWKYENHTSGSLKNELPGVLKSNGSNTEKINKTDSSETDHIYPAELQEEEQYRRYFKEALELEILERGYPADKAVLYEILELLVETVTSRKKFLRICGEEKPKEVVKSRLMKLDSSHIQYILECLKENSTQIRNMLKAPVILPNGEKIYPTKGTPQGGILSPLLANIVLNELDWWIASQWENMPTRTEFTIRQNRAGAEIKSHVYRALRRSNLKEMHSVRYADDFKIFCSSHTDAVKAYHATAKWLKDRLGLDISPEKSRIVNLKRQYYSSREWSLCDADSFRFRWRSYQKDECFFTRPKA